MKIQNIGGLCNRLRIMLGYAIHARALNDPEGLHFAWSANRYVNHYTGQFTVPGVSIIKMGLNEAITHTLIASATTFHNIAQTMLGGYTFQKESEAWSSIVWDPELVARAQHLADGVGLAAHCRGTDHNAWHGLKPVGFADRLEAYVRKLGDDAFPIYLATDDAAIEAEVVARFGGSRVRYLGKDLTQSFQPDLSNACIDLLACSYAKFFIGTRNSSFTDGIRALRNEESMGFPDFGYPAPPGAADLAVISCHFNFAGYDRPRANLHRFMTRMKRDGVEVYGVEAYTAGQTPITGCYPGWRQVQVPRHAVMFQKEALLNAAERLVPECYTKLAWVDADLDFDNPDWVRETSAALDREKVVQPFDRAVWLNRAGVAEREIPSTAAIAQSTDGVEGHPGFAYAARRKLWTAHGGLFPYCITGRGDCAAAAAFFGAELSALQRNAIGDTMLSLRRWREWAEPVARWTGGKVGLVSGAVRHDFHGERAKRKYSQRHEALEGMDIDRDLELRPEGYLQWSAEASPVMMLSVANYFAERDEDT